MIKRKKKNYYHHHVYRQLIKWSIQKSIIFNDFGILFILVEDCIFCQFSFIFCARISTFSHLIFAKYNSHSISSVSSISWKYFLLLLLMRFCWSWVFSSLQIYSFLFLKLPLIFHTFISNSKNNTTKQRKQRKQQKQPFKQ